MATLSERSPASDPGWRVPIFAVALALALAALVARLGILQIGEHEKYAQRASANQIRLVPLPAPRGRILDRHGHTLVRSRPSFICVLVPTEIVDPNAAIAALSDALQIPAHKLWVRVLNHNGVTFRDFAELVALAPYAPVFIAEDLSEAQMTRLAETHIAGIDVAAEAIRDYPYRGYGSHTFGYVGAITEDEYRKLRARGYTQNDVIGKDGLEYQYDGDLRGIPGGERVVVDAQGRAVRRLTPINPIGGHDLRLTMDWPLQTIAERALASGIHTVAVTRGRHISGAVVVLDPYNGGVLALASSPNFDPNDFVRGIGAKKFNAYLNDPLEPLYDRSIAAATATGSTFKMVTGSGALTAGVLKKDEPVYDSGAWNCHGTTFVDLAAGGLGMTSFVQALASSSDGYFYQAAYRLGYERLTKYARAFGIGSRLGIDLPGEYGGNWPTDAWTRKVYGVPMSPSDVCQLGIGQGAMQATPLQMASIVSAVVNGGTLYRPHVLDAVLDQSGRVTRRIGSPVVRQIPVTKAALEAVREGMARVTLPGGTAYGLGIDGLPFGGKTGTVETQGGAGPNTTWFVAFAPADHPKLAMAVFMERTGGYGAEVAAPIAREIILNYFKKRGGVPPVGPPSGDSAAARVAR